MAGPTCYYCQEPAEAECPTCGRLYCAEHGEDVCLRCLSPDSVLPSGTVFRGSLLALVAATVVGLFLWLRPPTAPASSGVVERLATNTPAITATATPTPALPEEATPTPRPSPIGGAEPVGSVTPAPSPTATPTPIGERTYTVQPGDSLFGIAERFGTTVEAILERNPGIVPETLQPGTELRIPPPEE